MFLYHVTARVRLRINLITFNNEIKANNTNIQQAYTRILTETRDFRNEVYN